MGGKGKGFGFGAGSLSDKIECLRYTLISFSIFSTIMGIVVFALSIWLRANPSFSDWIEDLDLEQFYIGIYVLLLVSCLYIIFSCMGCLFLVQENIFGLRIMIGVYFCKFLFGLVGTAVLLNYSTANSDIQPMIRESMMKLIAESQYARNAELLRLIQENVGCCGADGPSDYLVWKKPLPSECRDTVTGNAFFHGCVDELTWFIGDKTAWLAGVSMVLCFFTILKAVCTLILVKALKADNPN